MLKLFTDLQIFLVTLVGLILRIAPDDLAKDPLKNGFGFTRWDWFGLAIAADSERPAPGALYGDLLWFLLLMTTVPVVVTLLHQSPAQKAQRLLYRIAKTDADDASSPLAKQRRALRELKIARRAGVQPEERDEQAIGSTASTVSTGQQNSDADEASPPVGSGVGDIDGMIETNEDPISSKDAAESAKKAAKKSKRKRKAKVASAADTKQRDEAAAESGNPLATLGDDELQQETLPVASDDLRADEQEFSEAAGGWTQQHDPASGRAYWFNSVTKKSTWIDPRVAALAASPATADGARRMVATDEVQEVAQVERQDEEGEEGRSDAVRGWTQQHDPASGRAYWFNVVTKESTWTKPALAVLDAPEPAAKEPAEEMWVEHFSKEHQLPFWVSSASGVSSWSKPQA
eukprot:SAG31_NODE_3275_length_4474_cov_17.108114_2_plen_404_part_00